MSIEVNVVGMRCGAQAGGLSCTYCTAPDTPVLMADASWRPLGALVEGDRLWSFEEHGPDRRIVAGTVARTYALKRRAVRIVHEQGDLVVGRDHLLLRDIKGAGKWWSAAAVQPGHQVRMFVTPARQPPETDTYRIGYLCGIFEGDGTLGVYRRPDDYFLWAAQLVMRDTDALSRVEHYAAATGAPLQRFEHVARYNFNGYSRPGLQRTPGLRTRQRAIVARLAGWLAAPREADHEWLRGWLAGMFDAEGGYGDVVRISQKDQRRRQRILTALHVLGFNAVEEATGARLLGGATEAARFFGLVRPAILRKLDFGGCRRWGKASRVLAVEDAGYRDLADISVEGAPTYFAAGVASHNCYQGAVRRTSENAAPVRIDHAAVQLAVAAAAGKDGFTVFGGEPLLAQLEDLEQLWAFGFDRYGQNGVQTSGRPITEAHLQAFKRYRVHVGFSIDGPGELNDARRAGTTAQTREASAHSEAMLRRCLEEGISCSLIVTLHRLNARADRLPRLLLWFRELDAAGLGSARLHLLELDGPGKAIALTSEENVAALVAAHELEGQLARLRFDVFDDIEKKLRDPDASVTCTWNDCDPWTTPAVHGIAADGSRGLCQRVHKDGVQWLPDQGQAPRIRQAILWATPQEDGGCRGCRFFLQCGGQCPGTAIDGDWRKRSVDCPTWFALLERIELQLLARGERPASLAPGLEGLVARRLQQYASPSHHGDQHGDGHGDEHGDHTDHGDAPGFQLLGGEEVVG